MLANIYLRESIDEWFHGAVPPRLKGRARLVRYADDFIMVFSREDDARRVLNVLPKRVGKYGLSLHPDKTRLVDYRRRDRGNPIGPETFDFLGFTHRWGVSRNGRWLVKQRTAQDHFSRATPSARVVSCQSARTAPRPTASTRAEASWALRFQIESHASRGWAVGFLYGFQGPEQSSIAQGDVETEDTEAFNRGVLDGQGAATGGLEVSQPCVDLNVEPPSLFHFAADAGAEATFSLVGLTVKGISHLAGGVAEGIFAVVNLSIALETFSDDPDTAIAERAQRLRSALVDVVITSSMELFLGGGVDLSLPAVSFS